MMVDEQPLSSEQLLVRRLLRNRYLDEQLPPQPVVVLLGPAGSGKTFALTSISDDCGGGVVHAKFDFATAPEPSTVQVLTRASFEFSQKWPGRGTPQFIRFTLGLVAVQANLGGLNRGQDIETLRALINDLMRNWRAQRVAGLVGNLARAAVNANVLPAPLGGVIALALPALIRGIGRKAIAKGARWHTDIPQAQGTNSPLDALVTLNLKARVNPKAMVGWLTSAFLADVRESQPKLARRDPGSPCGCPDPSTGRHLHNWLLLLDNLDHAGGAEFVEDLLAARDGHLRHNPGQHDALLLVATSGKWTAEQNVGWRPPWQAEPIQSDGLTTVPGSAKATYQHWAKQRPTPYYPVRIEPLTIDETARVVHADELSVRAKLAQRITSGLPAALGTVTPLLADPHPRPGARDLLLRPIADDCDDCDDGLVARRALWTARLRELRLIDGLGGITIDDLVLAAPFATAPWLVPGMANLPFPQIGQILTELRSALWVTAPAHGGGTADYAELHPWISHTLVSALAAHGGAAYDNQFRTLLADPDTRADQARTGYCQLALGRVTDVIDVFEQSFNEGPHREWVKRLRLVTRAPDNRPPERDSYTLYEQLVQQDNRKVPEGRTPVGNIVRRLIIARWLSANPFAVPHPELGTVVDTAYGELPHWSRQPDVAELSHAARRDLHELF